MEPGSLIGQARSDFAQLTTAEFSDSATVTDGSDSIEIRGLFYEASIDVVPDTQASVTTPNYRLQLDETSTAFALRRKGLLVTCRSKVFKVREWTFDGLGGLTLILDEQKSDATPEVPVTIAGARTQYFQEADVIHGDSIRLDWVPLAGTIKVHSRGSRLVEAVHWVDNGDGSLTFLDLSWLPIGDDYVTVDYQIF